MLPVESSLSSIIFDDVEEHDSGDSLFCFFFCGETDTITRGPRMARLIVMNATDERMVKKTNKHKRGCMNKHTKHFK